MRMPAPNGSRQPGSLAASRSRDRGPVTRVGARREDDDQQDAAAGEEHPPVQPGRSEPGPEPVDERIRGDQDADRQGRRQRAAGGAGTAAANVPETRSPTPTSCRAASCSPRTRIPSSAPRRAAARGPPGRPSTGRRRDMRRRAPPSRRPPAPSRSSRSATRARRTRAFRWPARAPRRTASRRPSQATPPGRWRAAARPMSSPTRSRPRGAPRRPGRGRSRPATSPESTGLVRPPGIPGNSSTPGDMPGVEAAQERRGAGPAGAGGATRPSSWGGLGLGGWLRLLEPPWPSTLALQRARRRLQPWLSAPPWLSTSGWPSSSRQRESVRQPSAPSSRRSS